MMHCLFILSAVCLTKAIPMPQDINPIGGQPPILPPQPGFQNGQMGAPGLPPMGQTGLPMGQMGGPNGQFGQQNGQGMGGLNGQNGFGQNGMGNGQPMMN